MEEDVSRYLSDNREETSSIVMEGWLQEICEEQEFLHKRMLEVEKEKQEFIQRMNSFRKLTVSR